MSGTGYKNAAVPGAKYGHMTVLRDSARVSGRATWECLCDCGVEKTVQARHLISGHILSCGCRRSGKTHGMRGATEYVIWSMMKQRCLNPNHDHFARYGGRGVSICARWIHSFASFYVDMGKRPSPAFTLDRIDTDGNYEPGNCRWATKTEQARNNKRVKLFNVNGEVRSLPEWCDIYGANHQLVYARVKGLGWNAKDALEMPARGFRV